VPPVVAVGSGRMVEPGAFAFVVGVSAGVVEGPVPAGVPAVVDDEIGAVVEVDAVVVVRRGRVVVGSGTAGTY
jgi:hypothetical protein